MIPKKLSKKKKKMPGDIILYIYVYHKWQSYDVWYLRYGALQTELFVNLDRFLPFYPPMDPENQNFEKMKKKKTLEYIIILPMCTINDSRMMYGSGDMECNGQNFLSFWTIFCFFYPPNNPKNQKFEKMKKMPADIIILHICTINDNHMMYCFWDMKHDRQNFFVISDHFLPFYPTNNPKNQNLKKLKKAWRYYHFKHVYHKWQSYDVWFLRYWAWQTNYFVIKNSWRYHHFT